MWINRLLHVGNKTYIFDKNIFGLKYVVWTVQSFKWSLHLLNKCSVFWTFRMISRKLSKIARIHMFLKINGLQINIIQILSMHPIPTFGIDSKPVHLVHLDHGNRSTCYCYELIQKYFRALFCWLKSTLRNFCK